MFLDDRERSLKHITQPLLFVHAATAQCDAAPLLDTEHLASSHGHPLVRVGYEQLEPPLVPAHETANEPS